MEPITFKVKKYPASSDLSVNFSLQLVGSLPVHSLTTMSTLPWVVAEIQRLSVESAKEEPSASQIRLYVSPASLRCEPDTGKNQQWDPLICSSLFEYKPQHVHKLIHNSHDPSYFACLIKDGAANQQSVCYVFKADDQTKVPEIISSIRQAGKIARQGEFQNNLSDVEDPFAKKFEIGQSEVYLISPDTKKVAIEKSFKEISFCSQGIRHVDHFGFICRESSENGGFHFVCYVFQCTDEALVDEIMMTLKQAFTVAAVQQTSKTQPQLCEGCPLQSLHKLCEKIEGLHPSKTKLELQKHLTTLNSQEQALVFEEVKKLRPRNDQKENELVISVLRNMYEEKQRDHVHIGEAKQTLQPPAENAGNEVPSSTPRFRLDMLKNKAKRSLTESFENILSRGSKARGPLDSSGSVDLESSMSSMLSSISKAT
uniref:PID domain-containing protein n=1 Tax=Apteryx owenii TaxID=8824 RepID=A0A8B9Q297_APTOW